MLVGVDTDATLVGRAEVGAAVTAAALVGSAEAGALLTAAALVGRAAVGGAVTEAPLVAPGAAEDGDGAAEEDEEERRPAGGGAGLLCVASVNELVISLVDCWRAGDSRLSLSANLVPIIFISDRCSTHRERSGMQSAGSVSVRRSIGVTVYSGGA